RSFKRMISVVVVFSLVLSSCGGNTTTTLIILLKLITLIPFRFYSSNSLNPSYSEEQNKKGLKSLNYKNEKVLE
ncbi:MAG: hypothetical protein LE180_03420, partial [Endomicrobium sp.]|uniref:hypothetical protein n=1 Tax=Candidatus Endomicrobiellum pyrsonymphae TaxID=1408203 RepID=UPI003575FE26|nr:hypothetical protein [Endomicrobium sp.]